jgi:proliferating cell nuclear antigen PCNA
MEIAICDNKKAYMITTIFNHISNFIETLNLVFTTEKMYVQAMDKSHACLLEFVFLSTWFDSYNFTSDDQLVLGVHANILYRIFSAKAESQTINIIYKADDDVVGFDFMNGTGGEPNKYFEISLMDIPYSPLPIPNDTLANAEFTISTKRFCKLIEQLILFDEQLNIICRDDKILLEASGVEGKMKAELLQEDLIEFIVDDVSDDENMSESASVIDLRFSMVYIRKMCLFHQLTDEVSFRFSDINPMELKYDLGNGCYLRFFLAPQISD